MSPRNGGGGESSVGVVGVGAVGYGRSPQRARSKRAAAPSGLAVFTRAVAASAAGHFRLWGRATVWLRDPRWFLRGVLAAGPREA
jgi:hypothetical protein